MTKEKKKNCLPVSIISPILYNMKSILCEVCNLAMLTEMKILCGLLQTAALLPSLSVLDEVQY